MSEFMNMPPLLSQEPRVLSVGAPLFEESLAAQGVEVQAVDWQPPANGDAELARSLAGLWTPEVERANAQALGHLLDAQPVLVDVRPAGEVVPGMHRDMVLHAGPPIAWERMSPPVQAAALGALLHEGLAPDAESAERIAACGEVRFEPCHEHSAVGPMAGMTTYSM